MHSQWLSMSQRFARLWVVSSPCSPATWTNRTPRLSIMRRFGSGREFGLIGWAVAIARRPRRAARASTRPRSIQRTQRSNLAGTQTPHRCDPHPIDQPNSASNSALSVTAERQTSSGHPGRVTNVTGQRGEPHPPRQRQRVESKCRHRPPARETQRRSRRFRARPCQPKILRIK
jgi:hypothetical protein